MQIICLQSSGFSQQKALQLNILKHNNGVGDPVQIYYLHSIQVASKIHANSSSMHFCYKNGATVILKKKIIALTIKTIFKLRLLQFLDIFPSGNNLRVNYITFRE